VAVDLGAACKSYEAEGQWTSPVLFAPAEIARFLEATETSDRMRRYWR
jgi:hypothetical protein